MSLDLGWDAWGQVRETLEIEDAGKGRVSGHVKYTFDPQWQLDYNARARSDWSGSPRGDSLGEPIIELDPGTYLHIAKLNGVRPYSREHDEIVLKLARNLDWKNIKVVGRDTPASMVKSKWL